MVSCADNSIQNVPVYITVACFLLSEGANLEAVSKEKLTPLGLCPSDYRSLLNIFVKPERYVLYMENLHIAHYTHIVALEKRNEVKRQYINPPVVIVQEK